MAEAVGIFDASGFYEVQPDVEVASAWTGSSPSSASQLGAEELAREFRDGRSAPGMNRTCARGLGNRCSIH